MKTSALCILIATLAVGSAPEDPRPDLELLNVPKSQLGIEGYDPVAYFPEAGGKPLKGSPEIAQNWRGITYRFATEANRARFLENPDRFEPAYGGWCAWAMVEGDRVEIEPKSFLIQDGELLLFYDSFFADTRKSWSKGDEAALRTKADAAWQALHPSAVRDLSSWPLDEHGLALAGADPTAYFETPGQFVQGSAQFAWTYKSVTYHFATDAARAKFRREPWKFEPQLGGNDPHSPPDEPPVAGHPEIFLVRDGQLWLFASEASRAKF